MRATASAILAGLAIACAPLTHQDREPPANLSCRSTVSATQSVRWITPGGGRDRRRLDAWCTGVGRALVRSVARPPHMRSASLSELVFVSWNVHVGAGDVTGFVHDLRAGRFSQGRPVTEFVLLLQEAVRYRDVPAVTIAGTRAAKRIGSHQESVADIGEIARTLNMSVVYVPSMRNGATNVSDEPSSDRGNAVLSTLPVSEPVAVELPGARQRRVAVQASISIATAHGDDMLTVGSAHFNVLGSARTLWVFGAPATRAHQARALLAATKEGPMILGTDVNGWAGSDESAIRELRAAFPATPRSPPSLLHGGVALDWLFLRLPDGWRGHVTRVNHPYGSDHLPIIGTLVNATSSRGERF